MVQFPKLVILALTVLAAGPCTTLNAQVLMTTDVSPDAPFGTPQDSNGVDPSGRIRQVIIDPFADSTLSTRTMYAASIYSGVWKSSDGGQSWRQSSLGLRTGQTGGAGPFLATDGFGDLLYVTAPDDGRPNQPYGGLWVSIDSAATWHHVDPCGQTELNTSGNQVYSVVFAQGQPFVSTDCGIVTSQETNLTNPGGWHNISGSLPFAPRNTTLATQSSSLTLFACQGTQVWRGTSPLSPSPVWQSVNLPGSCGGQFGVQMAVAPQSGFAPEPSSVLLVCNLSSGGLEVELVDFNATRSTQIRPLNFTTVSNEGDCCGTTGVFVAPYRTPPPSGVGPGLSYDIYAGDGYRFYRYHADGTWHVLQGLHADTWSMAFPSTYDPYNGDCTAYSGNDGGLFINQISGVGNCIADGAENGWAQANLGLHVYASEAMAGLSRTCFITGLPCPILYDPSADDEVWVSPLGGVPGSSWHDLHAETGDAAQVLIDPALPTVAVTARLGGGCQLRYQAATDGNPITADNASSATCIEPPAYGGPAPYGSFDQTPHEGNVSQVMTMLDEVPLQLGDYIAATSPFFVAKCKDATPSCNDQIVRNVDGNVGNGIWSLITHGNEFGPGWIGQIGTSGGHTNPIIYVLTTNRPGVSLPLGNGTLWKGQFTGDLLCTPTEPFHWCPASGTIPNRLAQGYNLFVNPYDSTEIYVTDLPDSKNLADGANTIKTSRDGGQTWTPVQSLRDIATNFGEFDFGCGQFANGPIGGGIFQAACSLTDVNFVRDHPEIRVAALFPGGVAFSRDYGHHWLALNVTNAQPFGNPLTYDLIEMPTAVFYDPQPNPATGQPSIYVAIQGKGVNRVDGPFPTLVSGQVVFCTACVAGGGSIAGDAEVNIFVGALGTSVPLHLGSDGLFHGSVLFDSAKITTFDYHFDVNGKPTRSFRANLTPAEIASGVTTLTNARPPRFRGEIESHSQQAPGVVNVGFELTDVGEGAAQNLQIAGISFDTIRGNGKVTLDPSTAALLPILVGNLAEGGSQTVPLVLDVPASVEKFRMTVNGTAQDAIGRSLSLQITESLAPLGDRDDGDSRKN